MEGSVEDDFRLASDCLRHVYERLIFPGALEHLLRGSLVSARDGEVRQWQIVVPVQAIARVDVAEHGQLRPHLQDAIKQ